VPGDPVPGDLSGAGPVIRRRVLVHGRVQGVFFRDSCQREAQRLGVRGWVRNRSDGQQVEACFEGPSAAVAAMVRWCRTGPPRARVDDVVVHDEPVAGDARFRILGDS